MAVASEVRGKGGHRNRLSKLKMEMFQLNQNFFMVFYGSKDGNLRVSY